MKDMRLWLFATLSLSGLLACSGDDSNGSNGTPDAAETDAGALDTSSPTSPDQGRDTSPGPDTATNGDDDLGADVSPDTGDGARDDAGSESTLVADPLRLPVATTAQVPLVDEYDALDVPSLQPGESYLDPTTGVKIYRLTSPDFPTTGYRWGHAYADGPDEVSLPYDDGRRTIHVTTTDGSHRLIDFVPGVGVENPRRVDGVFLEMGISFSNNPATPHYAYVSDGSTIERVDVRTMEPVPGDGWPVTGEDDIAWMHQSANDEFFVWMRGANGSTVVGYEPATGTRKTHSNPDLNEPRIDRAGRYVGIVLDSNAFDIWDWENDTIVWGADGTIPFAHQASLQRRWYGVDWNESYPPDFTMFIPDEPNSAQHIGGPANGTLIHGSGNWIQDVVDYDDQWAVFLHYGSLRPSEDYWLAPGGMVLINASGERRLLAHSYNTSSDYGFYSFAKFSPDGRYVLFTSDMNGSDRSDLFLAELPVSPRN